MSTRKFAEDMTTVGSCSREAFYAHSCDLYPASRNFVLAKLESKASKIARSFADEKLEAFEQIAEAMRAAARILPGALGYDWYHWIGAIIYAPSHVF